MGIVLVSGGEVVWLARVYAVGLVVERAAEDDRADPVPRGAARRPRLSRADQRHRRRPRVAGRAVVDHGAARAAGAVPADRPRRALDCRRDAAGGADDAPGRRRSDPSRRIWTRRRARSTNSSCCRRTTRISRTSRHVRATCWCRCASPASLAHLTAALRAAGDRDVVAMTVRLVGVDVPDDPAVGAARDRRRAPAALGGRRAGRARSAAGAAADRARRQRLRRGRRNRAAARLGGDSRRRVGDAVGRRSGAAARRRVGAGAARARRSTSASSSITRAAAPPPITSARTRRRSSPKTSISFTGSGSTPPGPSARTCIITTSCAPH